GGGGLPEGLEAKLEEFLHGEKKLLLTLRDILTGDARESAHLNILIDECDYLWSHFPDYAGGRRPDMQDFLGDPAAALSAQARSFLNRLRLEVDRALALMDRLSERGREGRP
ncbi:MAG: hypothetical protein FWG66_02850, partial [Spirochaetes bacterium]|nr:hypothetical protein [Spirochaetota bacterium]